MNQNVSLTTSFLERIPNKVNFQQLISVVVENYKLGVLKKAKIIEIGYEDLNVIIITSLGKYVVKVFNKNKSLREIRSNIESILLSQEKNIRHPFIYLFNDSHIFNYNDQLNLIIMDYVFGKNFYNLGRLPNLFELKTIARNLAQLHQITYKPYSPYNPWLLINLEREIETLPKESKLRTNKIIRDLIKKWQTIILKNLPHSLIHGDLVKANVMLSERSIFFIDYSRSNYLPRIIDLAIVFSDLLFIENSRDFIKTYHLFLDEYQKNSSLSPYEIEVLPLFIRVTHAMYLIGATKEKNKGNKSVENQYWYELGYNGMNRNLIF